MLCAVMAMSIIQAYVAFGPTPIFQEVEMGRTLFEQGKGIDRTLRQDRAVIGLWFDGRIKCDVESAIWISPGVISRWLGYLEAKEKWPDGELQRRWSVVSSTMEGKISFFVRLSAMPRLHGIDMEMGDIPSDSEIVKVRFLLTSGPGTPENARYTAIPGVRDSRVAKYPTLESPEGKKPFWVDPIEVLKLDKWKVRDRTTLEQYGWFRKMPFKEAVLPEFDSGQPDPGYGLGDYQSAWYLVTFDQRKAPIDPLIFELRIFSEKKERIGRFGLALGNGSK